MLPFAPGSRVLIRDEEWLVRRIDPATDGGWLLTCDGISELVRSQSALFLTSLEDEIAVLDPEKTELIPDDTPAYNASILYLESLRRRNVANDDKVHLGHRGVMNLVCAARQGRHSVGWRDPHLRKNLDQLEPRFASSMNNPVWPLPSMTLSVMFSMMES